MKHIRTTALLIAVALLIVATLSPLAPAVAIILVSTLLLPVVLSPVRRGPTEASPRPRTRPDDPFHLRAPPLQLPA